MLFRKEKYTIGDVLVVERGIYHHYGIYVGNNQVVHFGSDSQGELLNPSGAFIKKTSIKDFSEGEGISVENLPYENRLAEPQIVANAESCVGTDFGGFNMLTNNSKHFARWCETGEYVESKGNNIADKINTFKQGIMSLFK